MEVALHSKQLLDKVSLDMHSKHPATLGLKSSQAITPTSFQNFEQHYNAVLLDGNEHPNSCTDLPLKGLRSFQKGGRTLRNFINTSRDHS